MAAVGLPNEWVAVADLREYSLRPVVVDAALAHAQGLVEYEDDGTAICRFAQLGEGEGDAPGEVRVAPARQFPAIRATFDDLNKTLSRLSNSPLIDGSSLRSIYERESQRYDELALEAHAAGRWEPDYGTYVFDHSRGALYLIAPKRWHRLALVTSNAMLLTDPDASLAWREVRARLEGAVVGFAGLSVGSNILEGWLREGRPDHVKLADPDWLELPNFNRCERASLRHVVASRAARFDPRSPYETPRVLKAEYAAYEHHLVDPYATFHVYSEGVTRKNIDRFLLGDGGDEPRIEVLVEETDNLDLKLLLRERCRAHGIDVIMMSDFGHRMHVLWNFFAREPESSLGYLGDDDALRESLAKIRAGDRRQLYEFVRNLCGEDFGGPAFFNWLEGRGEQPTSSLPQAGATAMSAGAIGGKEIALHVLGHNERRAARRVIYDLLGRRTIA